MKANAGRCSGVAEWAMSLIGRNDMFVLLGGVFQKTVQYASKPDRVKTRVEVHVRVVVASSSAAVTSVCASGVECATSSRGIDPAVAGIRIDMTIRDATPCRRSADKTLSWPSSDLEAVPRNTAWARTS
jgi:hypothetical protein